MEVTSPTFERVRVWHELVQLQGERITSVQHQEFQVSGDFICCVSTVRFLGLDTLYESGRAAGFGLDWVHEAFGWKPFQEGEPVLIMWFYN